MERKDLNEDKINNRPVSNSINDETFDDNFMQVEKVIRKSNSFSPQRTQPTLKLPSTQKQYATSYTTSTQSGNRSDTQKLALNESSSDYVGSVESSQDSQTNPNQTQQTPKSLSKADEHSQLMYEQLLGNTKRGIGSSNEDVYAQIGLSTRMASKRISVQLDFIPKNNRLTKRIDQVPESWTIVDDHGKKQVEEITDKQKKWAQGKIIGMNARYELQTNHKKQGLSILQTIMKFFETDSIEITREAHLPIALFHYQFKNPQKADQIEKARLLFQERFWSTIWCCYRQNFYPLLANDKEGMQKIFKMKPPDRVVRLGYTNDCGWGCTIRVSQMLICHSILRATLGDYTLKKLGNSEEYIQVLTLINDNMDGQQGAFSIQNVIRMSLIFGRYPGEWHGNKSISLVFSHLNKIYSPIHNFEICLFGDESVFLDKVQKKAQQAPRNWIKYQKAKFEKLSEERLEKVQMIDALFNQFLTDQEPEQYIAVQNSLDGSQRSMLSASEINLSPKDPEILLKEKAEAEKWKNTVLVIVCVRLGMNKVQEEYLDVIKTFFASKINAGILGGRPGEAYYLIGLQEGYLIFLDPHKTQDSIQPETPLIRKEHMTYHESSAKKIHFSKLDPSLGFAFLLRRQDDFIKFQDFMRLGKQHHKKNWIFHTEATKPEFMKSRPKQKKTKVKKSEKRSSFELIDDGFEAIEDNEIGMDLNLNKSKSHQQLFQPRGQPFIDSALQKKFLDIPEESKFEGSSNGDDYGFQSQDDIDDFEML